LGFPPVARVPWSPQGSLGLLLPWASATAWRDPSGSVAVLPLELHEDWVGRSVRDLEEATGCRVAFIMRFGTGVLPDSKSVLQADDQV
ncbi:TrkA C-terminal domain-containing protein, partial [Saccharothrix sp. MB29]|nr:TrkA C-terminal domain-containing protein [Saccharothrix sp. MB29]